MFSLRRLPCTFHPDPCLASATSPSALETPCIRKSRRWSRSTALYAANLPHDVAPQFSCDAGAPRLSDGMRRRSRGASIKVSTPTTRVAPAWWPNRAPTAGRFGDLPTPLIGALDLLDCDGPLLYSSRECSSIFPDWWVAEFHLKIAVSNCEWTFLYLKIAVRNCLCKVYLAVLCHPKNKSGSVIG
jgi:hypothetical protein